MRSVETILGVIRERGRRRLLLSGIYRQLYNRNLYLHAYGRLYRNNGVRQEARRWNERKSPGALSGSH
jgi:hypothetical protein